MKRKLVVGGNRVRTLFLLAIILTLALLFLASPPLRPNSNNNINQNEAQQVIFVMGMHHSMTSVATKLLLDTGLFYGGARNDLLLRRDNPMKYWELRKCVAANQALFRGEEEEQNSASRHGLYNWIGYGIQLKQRTGSKNVQKLAHRARQVLEEMVVKSNAGERGRILIKDPRLSLTIRIWAEQALALRLAPECVVLVRDPVESAYRFLADYQVLSAREWASVWEQYTFQALSACLELNLPVHIVRHEDYGVDPVGTTSALASRLLRDARGAVKIDFPLAAEWKLKHERKQATWLKIKPHLPLLEDDLLSREGRELAKVLRLGEFTTLPRVFSEWTTRPPQWVELTNTGSSSNLFYSCRITSLLNAKVLIRSILVHDASRRFYAWGAVAAENVEALERMGWSYCDAPDCEKGDENAIVLDGDSFAIAPLKFVPCKNGECGSHETLFNALAGLGGRVSEQQV